MDHLALCLALPEANAFGYLEGEDEAEEVGLPVAQITAFSDAWPILSDRFDRDLVAAEPGCRRPREPNQEEDA